MPECIHVYAMSSQTKFVNKIGEVAWFEAVRAASSGSLSWEIIRVARSQLSVSGYSLLQLPHASPWLALGGWQGANFSGLLATPAVAKGLASGGPPCTRRGQRCGSLPVAKQLPKSSSSPT